MSLSAPAPRRHKHTRTIVCEGFARDDGLWDIEARIVDTKTFRYKEPYRGLRESGQHVHDMQVRLTVSPDMVVRAVEVSMNETPYPLCLGAPPAYQGLVGKKIGLGWRRAVQEVVGGVRGCTHVRELLFPMATVAFQSMGGWKEGSDDEVPAHTDDAEGPRFLDGCRAWATDGEVVARLHPRFYRGPKPEVTPG